MATQQKYKRLSPRRNLSIPVGLLVGGVYIMGRSFEIGEGGMRIICSTTVRIESGYTILITLRIPGASVTTLRGVIRFCQYRPEGESQFGVQFLNLNEKICRSIRTYVSQKTVKEAEDERDRWFQNRAVKSGA